MFRTFKILWKRNSRQWINKMVAWRISNIPERQFLYILSFVIGLASGLAALILKNLIHFVAEKVEFWAEGYSINYLYFIFPLIGILLTVLFIRYFVKDDIGHGVSKILHAISRKSGLIKLHNTWSSMAASSLTIGLGGSVGAEAPIVLTGASIGSNLASIFKLNYKYITLMIGCGAAGAISGIFNAPIAGIIFTLEVLMLDMTMAYLIPLLISAVTATVLSYFFLEEAALLRATNVSHFDVGNIGFYILLGIFIGLVAIYFTRMTMFFEMKMTSIKSWFYKILVGGIILGLLIYLFPPLYGEGYIGIISIFKGEGASLMNTSPFPDLGNNAYFLLLFLFGILVFKVLAMAATTGSGGVGGIFAPSLFMGAVGGYFFAFAINTFNDSGLPETNFALAGMAGMMAAVMHAPLTAIFLTAEVTRGYELLIPLIITSTVSYVTIMRFEPHSVYTKRLAQRRELITHHKDKAVLMLMDIKNLIETDFEVLAPSAKLRDLVKAISSSKRNLYPVVDEKGFLMGMVKLSDVKNLIFEQELYDSVMVKDLMYMPESFISSSDNMEDVAEKFETSGHYNLAVIDEGRYLGFISRAVVFSKYRKTLQHFSHD